MVSQMRSKAFFWAGVGSGIFILSQKCFLSIPLSGAPFNSLVFIRCSGAMILCIVQDHMTTVSTLADEAVQCVEGFGPFLVEDCLRPFFGSLQTILIHDLSQYFQRMETDEAFLRFEPQSCIL